MISKSLTEMLGIKYPIFQGGMAWVSDASLASAVSQAGGLGIIAAGNAPADWLHEEITKAQQLTNKPLGVNIMLLSPHIEEVIDMVLNSSIEVVVTGAGNPGPYIEKFQEAGKLVIPVISSIALAKRLESKGVDAVIAEGMEAGGHIGSVTTMALIPQLVDELSIPVIAAGGIADSRGVVAALALGAVGVQLGTRFLVAKECNVHMNYKQKIISASERSTVITGNSTGHPVRTIKNRLAREYAKLEKSGVSMEELEKLGSGKLKLAVIDGDVDFGSPMAGQIAGLVKCEQTVNEIIQEIVSGIPDTLKDIKEKFIWEK
ncbi:MAG: enoyl-[acyl-carrier-protein] reductase FabK [Clostridia bacterium]